MDRQEIINIIGSLPIKTGTDTNNTRLDKTIGDTADIISPLLTAHNLRITTGGTNPTSQRSYTRIYLEPITSATHDPRHNAYNVVRTWEWQTHSKYGFAPISHRAISQFCAELIREAQNG